MQEGPLTPRTRKRVEKESALRVVLCLIGLLIGMRCLYYLRGGSEAGALQWFGPSTIAGLFVASNGAFLGSTLLMLWRVVQDPLRGAIGISRHSQMMHLGAVVLRAGFALSGHFGNFWFTWGEELASIVVCVALVALLEPAIARVLLPRGGQGGAPERFPSALISGACLLIALLGFFFFSDEHLRGVERKRWGLLAASTYLEAASILPQRAMFLKTKRLPAATSHAFFLLALAGVLRFLMWVVLIVEGEFHLSLMLGDFSHTALLADFVMLYMRAIRQQGFDGLSEVSLSVDDSV